MRFKEFKKDFVGLAQLVQCLTVLCFKLCVERLRMELTRHIFITRKSSYFWRVKEDKRLT